MRVFAWIAIVVMSAVFLTLSAVAQDDKTPSVKQIMTKLNKDDAGLTTVIGKAINEEEPKWDDIKKQAREYVTFVDSLGKNKPPRGDKDSWAKLTKAYADNAKALSAAADKKNLKAATTAQNNIQGSCRTCHKAHKPL